MDDLPLWFDSLGLSPPRPTPGIGPILRFREQSLMPWTWVQCRVFTRAGDVAAASHPPPSTAQVGIISQFRTISNRQLMNEGALIPKQFKHSSRKPTRARPRLRWTSTGCRRRRWREGQSMVRRDVRCRKDRQAEHGRDGADRARSLRPRSVAQPRVAARFKASMTMPEVMAAGRTSAGLAKSAGKTSTMGTPARS